MDALSGVDACFLTASPMSLFLARGNLALEYSVLRTIQEFVAREARPFPVILYIPIRT